MNVVTIDAGCRRSSSSQPPVDSTADGHKKRMSQVSGSFVEDNAMLMSGVKGQNAQTSWRP